MISHVCLGTADLDRAVAFHDAVLGRIGLVRKFREADWAAWKHPDHDRPLLCVTLPFNGALAAPGNGTMVAFNAPSRAAVDAAHATGLAMGGTCEGPPGLRPHYTPDYYGAYLRDPDGNKLCFVCRDGSSA
ncbi:VOC family protein [Rhodovarius crocodyli]|uniref:VOC family protein n=1 Tax=Rhodovarius crocodyli TaxID=1979269 RepID=A0A437MCG2_9PROT|nr:VOC family protein [Rhodovarius crocodyli]RVT95336.1 VOC family protein [Rhodovarius crocodyli]